MKLEVNLNTGFFENYKDLIPFQGDLKKYTNEKGKQALMQSIVSEGIIFPTFIWKDKDIKYIWDGHGRQEVYKELEAKGFEIPKLPVVYILAKNRVDAKIKLLKKEQDYRRNVTQDGLLNFVDNESIDLSVLNGINLTGIGELDLSYFDKIIDNNKIEETITGKKETNKKPDNVVGDHKNTNEEINTESFGNDLDHVCPRCRFEFND